MIQNPTRPVKPYHTIIALLLAFFGFAMSAGISRGVFERLPHLEDEIAYLYEAKIIAGGNFVIESPQPRQAYWQPFVVDSAGQRFGKYTPGWPAQLAAGVLLGQAWVINAFFSALTVALVYRLGREIYSPDVGVFAAGLTAFSPMALLLSGTLMGHTAALFALMLFIYAYWRLERGKHRLRWGLVAGIALGLLVTNRPLTALGASAPFIAWSGVRLLRTLLASFKVGAQHIDLVEDSTDAARAQQIELVEASSDAARAQRAAPLPGAADNARTRVLLHTLSPLALLSLIALVMSLSIPLFNYQATGDASRNLYTLVWSYDRLGYGEGYGRNGHTLEKGVRHMRFDLSLMAADLFGWQLQPLTNENTAPDTPLYTELTFESDYWTQTGVSWLLLPFGLIVAYGRKSLRVAFWLLLGFVWLALPFLTRDINHIRDPQIAWIIVIGLMLWLVAPLLVLRDRVHVWTWLLISVALALIIVQLTYWIGSQRYSTRYYFESLPALALISALPIAWLCNSQNRLRISGIRPVVYVVFAALLVYSLFFYSLPRISVLRGYNLINRQIIEAVEGRREGDSPVLVIITGDDVRWRSYGALMAMTSPYLDSPIVAARASAAISRDAIIERFPGWQIIDMQAQENTSWFVDEGPPEGVGVG